MHIHFGGRKALVTGAANGIGAAIAERLAAAGAKVVATDILDGALAGVASATITPAVCDLTKKAEVERLVHDHGPFDILVHSAGGVRGQVGRPLEDVTEEDWDAIVGINMKAAFFLAQAIAPAMKRQRYGRIVLISSGAGLGVSLTGIQAYASAKAGEIGLTRQLGHELGRHGITVNSIAPGFVLSNQSTERQWKNYGPARQKEMVDHIATRRLGTPGDIASAVMFLVSDHASWICGQVLSVDGGK